MTLNLFLIESAGSHSLHRPGWTIEEEPPDSAQYHAAKTKAEDQAARTNHQQPSSI